MRSSVREPLTKAEVWLVVQAMTCGYAWLEAQTDNWLLLDYYLEVWRLSGGSLDLIS